MTADLIKTLQDGKHTLVVANGETRAFDGRGVSDLYDLLTEDKQFLKGASVADKVIGKGAASLMILGGVSEVYGCVVCTPAVELFESRGVRVGCGCEVPHIINRTGDGLCPLEVLCQDCATAEECLPLIADFMDRKRKASK